MNERTCQMHILKYGWSWSLKQSEPDGKLHVVSTTAPYSLSLIA